MLGVEAAHDLAAPVRLSRAAPPDLIIQRIVPTRAMPSGGGHIMRAHETVKGRPFKGARGLWPGGATSASDGAPDATLRVKARGSGRVAPRPAVPSRLILLRSGVSLDGTAAASLPAWPLKPAQQRAASDLRWTPATTVPLGLWCKVPRRPATWDVARASSLAGGLTRPGAPRRLSPGQGAPRPAVPPRLIPL